MYYNRFRYYDPSVGSYISQDPIRLAGNNPTLYGYVTDPNTWLDVFGLDGFSNWNAQPTLFPSPNQSHPILPDYDGTKTYGVVVTEKGTYYLQSGVVGPAKSMPKGSSGFDLITRTHVEGHAVAIMHQTGAARGTLFINQMPCSSCDGYLNRMLPKGAELEVNGPNGGKATYKGCH